MNPLVTLFEQPKNRKLAIIAALVSAMLPFPIAGCHKFYLGQPVWGVIYLLLWNTPIPRIACAIDVVWYFIQGEIGFERQFNGLEGENYQSLTEVNPQQVKAMADAVRELDKLREDGLISEYEFEQKRRQLLE
ncbi:MAG: SHOCT domain-containing protein [Microcystaceae cyanobacterium]